MRHFPLVAAICLISSACDVRQKIAQPPQPGNAVTVAPSPVAVSPPTSPTVPADTSYSVAQRENTGPFGDDRRLDVSLEKRVSEVALRLIAFNVKRQEQGGYKKLLIFFRIRGKNPKSGAWARADFDPDLKIKILGISDEQEKKLRITPKDATREVVGSWMDLGFNCRITIFRRDGKIYAEQVFKDGSNRTEELIEKSTPAGIRFDVKNPINPQVARESDDHWLLDQSGDLQDRNKEGTFATHKKLP